MFHFSVFTILKIYFYELLQCINFFLCFEVWIDVLGQQLACKYDHITLCHQLSFFYFISWLLFSLSIFRFCFVLFFFFFFFCVQCECVRDWEKYILEFEIFLFIYLIYIIFRHVTRFSLAKTLLQSYDICLFSLWIL